MLQHSLCFRSPVWLLQRFPKRYSRLSKNFSDCAGASGACEAAQELRAYLGTLPALAQAMRRLVASRQCSTGSQAGKPLGPTDSSQKTAAEPALARQHEFTEKLAMQALLSTLQPPDASMASGEASATRRPDQATLPVCQATASANFAQILMSAPQLLSGMPSQVRTQLTSLKAFETYTPALELVARQEPQSSPIGQSQLPASAKCQASCRRYIVCLAS